MEASKYMDLINEIEESFPVNSWKVRNIRIWPLLRIQLANLLHYYDESCAEDPHNGEGNLPRNLFYVPRKAMKYAVKATSLLKKVVNSACAQVLDYSHNAYLDNKLQVVFLTHSNARFFKDNKGLWWDVFCFPFIEYFNKQGVKSIILEFMAGKGYRIPRANSSFLLGINLYLEKLKGVALSCLSAKPSFEEFLGEGYNNFVDFLIARGFPVSYWEILRIEKIVRQGYLLWLLAEYFKQILCRISPSLGFTVCYYGLEGMAFNLACKELGIASVDIQHGVQGRLHSAYGRWHNVPQEGYELLPKWFWCWETDDAEAINEWAINTEYHRAFAGGNLWWEMWKSGENKEWVECYSSVIITEKEKNGNKPCILFTLQWGVEVDRWVWQVIRETSSSLCWWIRLHPDMGNNERLKFKKILRTLGISNDVELDKASNFPLPALLQHVDAHITAWSSCVIDAKFFGVPSIVIHQYGIEFFNTQIQEGWVIPALTPSQLIKALYIQIEKKNQMRLVKKGYAGAEEKIKEFLMHAGVLI